MIKFYLYGIGLIVSALIIYRIMVPTLFSLNDDFAMVLAGVIALVYPIALAVVTKKVWKLKK